MATVQAHYAHHLGPIYTWMVGGIDAALERGAAELDTIGVSSSDGAEAIDLGAGFGMHAIPLAQRGFNVTAIDSCAILLDTLCSQAGNLPIRAIQDNFLSYPRHLPANTELILCMGDTLTHLPSKKSVATLTETIANTLDIGGRFVATFRDYSSPLIAEERFISVHSDENRILSCFLEYTETHVIVHDILHDWKGSRWQLNVGTYSKLRISPDWFSTTLQEYGFNVTRNLTPSGMVRFLAQRLEASRA